MSVNTRSERERTNGKRSVGAGRRAESARSANDSTRYGQFATSVDQTDNPHYSLRQRR